ncbi:MAG: N-6 DNA methylase [Candidatus Micrarchaeia archaeon]|jgi:type I restriction-modification system DNA methylase subunit
MDKGKRRDLGVHLTSVNIFKKFIFPKIKNKLNDYIWVDLFAGEGNLILPILEQIEKDKRIEFFKANIYLFDIQSEMVDKSIQNAVSYGIPKEIAEKNILQLDTLKNYPKFLLNSKKPVFHITNPPYLYLGYISKHEKNKEQQKLFTGVNKGYQDLYQIALINDLRNNLKNMIYIIPSNFLFGAVVSNKIRDDFLSRYNINEAVIFEKKIFDFTGTNVIICFFEKTDKINTKLEFDAIKINCETKKRHYKLSNKNHFRAGFEFYEYTKKIKKTNSFSISFYLTENEINENLGKNKVVLLDSKKYTSRGYLKKEFFVNDYLYKKILSNPFFIRTVDTGSIDGKAGIYNIQEVFGVDGIFISGATYRTCPIQMFLTPTLTDVNSKKLIKEFNNLLNKLRENTDSEFMTTYKYSNGTYIRKYLGLSQVKNLMQTFSLSDLSTYIEDSTQIEEYATIEEPQIKRGLEQWF